MYSDHSQVHAGVCVSVCFPTGVTGLLQPLTVLTLRRPSQTQPSSSPPRPKNWWREYKLSLKAQVRKREDSYRNISDHIGILSDRNNLERVPW